jgi:hypothetical protein
MEIIVFNLPIVMIGPIGEIFIVFHCICEDLHWNGWEGETFILDVEIIM